MGNLLVSEVQVLIFLSKLLVLTISLLELELDLFVLLFVPEEVLVFEQKFLVLGVQSLNENRFLMQLSLNLGDGLLVGGDLSG